MSTADLIEALAHIRSELRSLEHQEQTIRDRLLTKLDRQHTNTFTTPHYKLTRTWSMREHMQKRNVPIQVWNQYATQMEVETLRIKPR
jgi:phosphopantetheinyl transferase (holo-ACP synthase)